MATEDCASSILPIMEGEEDVVKGRARQESSSLAFR